MSGKAARRKGFGFERFVANLLKPFFPKAQRQLEYQANQCMGVDLANTGIFAIQCKAYKKYAPITKIFEIKVKDKINLLITKGDRLPPMVTMSLDDFLLLMDQMKEMEFIYENQTRTKEAS